MKYTVIGSLDHIPDERSWEYDDCGNRIDKETGDFVVLVLKKSEIPPHQPIGLVKVDNQWVPKQMEFDFG